MLTQIPKCPFSQISANGAIAPSNWSCSFSLSLAPTFFLLQMGLPPLQTHFPHALKWSFLSPLSSSLGRMRASIYTAKSRSNPSWWSKEQNFITKQTRKSPHLWLQEKSHQISTSHQLPHLILLTNGLQMSLHLFQICLLQLITHRKKEPPHIFDLLTASHAFFLPSFHRNCFTKNHKTKTPCLMACAFAYLLFTPNHHTCKMLLYGWLQQKQAYKLSENKIHNQHDFGATFHFVKYKTIFNKSPPDLYFTKIPTQIPFNKMWVQTNVSQISTAIDIVGKT